MSLLPPFSPADGGRLRAGAGERELTKRCWRVALLFGGKILYDAPPEEFLRAKDPAVRQFVEGKAGGPLTVDDERLSHKRLSEGA